MAQNFAEKLLLAKIEAVEGTDAGPTAAADAVLTSGLTLTPVQGDRLDRNLDGATTGNSRVALSNKRMDLRFSVELAAVAAAGDAPGIATLLKVCGMSETIVASAMPTADTAAIFANGASGGAVDDASPLAVGDTFVNNMVTHTLTAVAGNNITFEPVLTAEIGNGTTIQFNRAGSATYVPRSSGVPSATTWFYSGNDLFKFVACRGTWGLEIPGSGYPRFQIQLQGAVDVPEDVAAVPAGTFTHFPDPSITSRDNTPVAQLDGVDIVLRELTYAHGLELVTVDVPNFAGTRIPDRAPTAALTLEEPRLTAKNWFDVASGADPEVPLRLVHGAAAGRRVEIEMPSAQILEDITEVDLQGVKGLRLTLNPIATAAGNDEIKIAWL